MRAWGRGAFSPAYETFKLSNTYSPTKTIVPRKKKVRYPRKIAGVKKAYLWNKDPITIVASGFGLSLSRAEENG